MCVEIPKCLHVFPPAVHALQWAYIVTEGFSKNGCIMEITSIYKQLAALVSLRANATQVWPYLCEFTTADMKTVMLFLIYVIYLISILKCQSKITLSYSLVFPAIITVAYMQHGLYQEQDHISESDKDQFTVLFKPSLTIFLHLLLPGLSVFQLNFPLLKMTSFN